MDQNIHQFTTLTFDCYGTLIDWESGIWDALQPLLMASNASQIDRKTGLEAFARIETAQEADTPDMVYPELLIQVHRNFAKQFELNTQPVLDRAFGASVPHWPAFPDTADALRTLKKHFNLVILSNVNRDEFAASNQKLGVEFDAIYTAEDIGSYKPDPENFSYMLKHLQSDLGVTQEKILHTAQSLHHDHVQAKKFDLANAWVDRQNLKNSDSWGATARVDARPAFDFYFTSMKEMAEYCEGGAKD